MICVGATTEVEALKKARKKLKARVNEVQQELQDAVKQYETLKGDASSQETKLSKARQSAEAARVEAQGALQEIQEAKKITAGKAFSMQSKYVKKKYFLLTRIRSSPGAFADLPRSASDVAEFFRAEEGSSTEKLFWSQYLAPEHPVPFTDQLKQLVELHRVAEPAMKDLIIRLWPAEAIPRCYFGLVKRLVNAYPRLDVVKRSVCIDVTSQNSKFWNVILNR